MGRVVSENRKRHTTRLSDIGQVTETHEEDEEKKRQ